MKKIVSVLIILTVITSPLFAFAANDDITVTVDGENLVFDQNPIMENDRVLVPFRAIFEKLGCSVYYYEEIDSVYAENGSSFIYLTIGSDTMMVNGEEINLDVPAKIVNDRTLVPIRAVSEAMDASVDWVDDTQTVVIESKHGQHTYEYLKNSKDYKNSDGLVILTVNYNSLKIKNPDNSYEINALNNKIAQDVEDFLYDAENIYLPEAEEYYKYYLENFAEAEFTPYTIDRSFAINTDRNNIFSITYTTLYDFHGVHPSTEKISEIFSLEYGRPFGAEDILSGNEKETENIICSKFIDKIDKDKDSFFEDAKDSVRKGYQEIQYYLTDTSLVAYASPYLIAPYAAGFIEVEIPYKGNEDLFKINLEYAEVDEMKISLVGNITTGFEWTLISTPTDKVSVSDYDYISDENPQNMVGVGGTFDFTVKGVKQGNYSLEFGYARSWETDIPPIHKIKYDLYISKDGKITLLNTET
ncbi:MAG: protease inhibitor I42 family protein, partial [Clostridia bacterium]|nr:protease inhibitor I42 family protein [Clostridia bacterium]